MLVTVEVMEATIRPDIAKEADAAFVTKADWIPGFWNFIDDLDREDLIAELVQNDLDQGATRTVVSFGEHELICEGNGRPVDQGGWERLSWIQGAGHDVPAKHGKIGVKNHGLKTAFTIGDEILLSSAGKAIIQTLYSRGRDQSPHPGASRSPAAAPDAPFEGCRIVVRYREQLIAPRSSESIVLGPVGPQEIEALFKMACVSIPQQFAGIVSPEIAPRYEIIVRHWRLGEARFTFSCSRPHRPVRGIDVFRRRCRVSGTASSLPDDLLEQAARRLLPLKGRPPESIPDFFRRANRHFVEVSWRIDGRGKPQTGDGRFRYPIGYPGSAHEARTGFGFFFNAPLISDTERHGPARNDATNEELRGACETLAIDTLARWIVPAWGPDALNPLVPATGAEEISQRLLAELASRNAIPTVTRSKAIALGPRRRRKSARGAYPILSERTAPPRKYRFVLPVATWQENALHPALTVLCPSSEFQIDPRVHPRIIGILDDNATVGFGETFVTFDEQDAVARIEGAGNDHFEAFPDPEASFSDLLVASASLDIIKDAFDHEKIDADQEKALRETLLLPDRQGVATPLEQLFSSAPLPSDIPGLGVPPILHEALASHPLFRRKKWHRSKYTTARFLESKTLETADDSTRRRFFSWLSRNERHIRPRDRRRLTALSIWPDTHGALAALSDLCEPRSRQIARILADAIRRPHARVRRSSIALPAGRRPLIRRVPTADEIEDWLRARLAPLEDGPANKALTSVLRALESDLAILSKDAVLARALRTSHADLPALAQDGAIRRRSELVMPASSLSRLALPKRFVLKSRTHAAVLDRLRPSLSGPTVAMLIAAFAEDRENFAALQARLARFFALTAPSDECRQQLAGMPIIPVHGRARAPDELALRGSRGDYWGAWKIPLSTKGLSQDDQRRYLDAGVTSALPTEETSRAFFEWLAGQDVIVLSHNIACVLRNILHRNGPENWANSFTSTPFIPAQGTAGLRLVALQTARHRPVFLPDPPDLAAVIAETDPDILLVIDRVKEVADPVALPLRRLGVRTLRDVMLEPDRVQASGNPADAEEHLRTHFRSLRLAKFHQTLHKRLDALGVDLELVRRDWSNRLSRVNALRFADEINVRYRLRARSHWISADAGFDPESGTFWIKRDDDGDLRSIFYEAIAKQLIFKPQARPLDLMALERALALEIKEPSFARSVKVDGLDQISDQNGAGHEAESDNEGDELGESLFGHAPFKPDPGGNVPKPGPIPSAAKPRRQSGPGNSSGGPGPSDAPYVHTPQLEKDHVVALKADHYASHCQMCLCVRSPEELAPAGSYVEWAEIRRRVIEAHHLDLKSAGGARHAGNLVLLCKFHHDNFGRRLTRAGVTAAIQARTAEKTISFDMDDGGRFTLKGKIADVAIHDTGEVVRLFFTDQHIAYWLAEAA